MSAENITPDYLDTADECLAFNPDMTFNKEVSRVLIKEALEALAAEKDDYCVAKTKAYGELIDKAEAEAASLRSEVERLKGDEKYRHEQQYLLQKEVQAKHEQLTLALKERDAYREVAMKNEANFRQVARFSYDRPIDEFVDAEALRLLQVPGRDGGQNLLSSASSEVSKFSSEGKK